MKFRSYDSLRIFDAVARTQSMTIASQDLNLSKGSISYQINKLEMELGFVLFDRLNARLQLTDAGLRLWHASHNALTQIDREIDDLRGTKLGSLSIGALTYFSSRWLSPKLMSFFEKNPGVNLRIDSINSIDDPKIKEVDLAILWGFEEWKAYDSRLLINLPAVPIGNPSLANKVESLGVSNALKTIPLLGDSSGDIGWRAWHKVAGLPYEPNKSSLTIPDSNSRVQAVINGQGIGLWDDLVTPEMETGKLKKLSEVKLENAGYHLIITQSNPSIHVQAMIDWLIDQGNSASI